jgi:hypothetical protein
MLDFSTIQYGLLIAIICGRYNELKFILENEKEKVMKQTFIFSYKKEI